MRTVYTDTKGRRWDRDAIIRLLDENDAALERALLLVFRNQTSDEQRSDQTSWRNGEGFTGGGESEFLSSLAKQCLVNKGGRPEGRRLSPRQREALRARNSRGVPKLGKYWQQVLPEIERRDHAQV